MKKFFKNLVIIVFRTVFVVMVVIAALIGWTMVPSSSGSSRVLVVVSGSMSPAIPVGSLVLVKPSKSYSVGDIITFNPEGSTRKDDFITHRIIAVEGKDAGRLFTTKGDANKAEDVVQINQGMIQGKVVLVIALLGYIIGYLKTLPGLIIIVILAVFIIYEEVKKISFEIKNIKNNKKKRLKTIAQKGKKMKNNKKIKKTRK